MSQEEDYIWVDRREFEQLREDYIKTKDVARRLIEAMKETLIHTLKYEELTPGTVDDINSLLDAMADYASVHNVNGEGFGG